MVAERINTTGFSCHRKLFKCLQYPFFTNGRIYQSDSTNIRIVRMIFPQWITILNQIAVLHLFDNRSAIKNVAGSKILLQLRQSEKSAQVSRAGSTWESKRDKWTFFCCVQQLTHFDDFFQTAGLLRDGSTSPIERFSFAFAQSSLSLCRNKSR